MQNRGMGAVVWAEDAAQNDLQRRERARGDDCMSKDRHDSAAEVELRQSVSAGSMLVRQADARSVDDSVELILEAESDGETPQRLRLRLPRKIAQDLALRLVHCAANLACICVGFLGSLDDGLVDRATDLAASFC
jgi:hypothetical protein